MASDPNQHVSLDKVDARQGSTRPKLIYVLVGGVALVIVAFIIVALIR